MSELLYRDDYILVRSHRPGRVAIQVGRPPEAATPTITDAQCLRDALDLHLTEDGDD